DFDRGKRLRWFGINREEREPNDLRCEVDIVEAGYKFHMNNVAAAVGRENLRHLAWIAARHRDNARFYDAAFRAAVGVKVATEHPGGTSAAGLDTIHVSNRDELMRKLLDSGIGASKVHSRNDQYSAFSRFRR